MPRQLNDEPCEITFFDRISNSKLTLYHRMPTTDERIAYANEQIIRKGGKVVNNAGEARIKFGLKIFTGFKEGDFTKGDNQPMSSDPKSPLYDPAWKTIVKQYASDVIILLCVHVFDASVSTQAPEEAEADDEAAAEEKPAEGKDKDPL